MTNLIHRQYHHETGQSRNRIRWIAQFRQTFQTG